MTELDRQLLRDNLWSLWNECNQKYQNLAHRNTLNFHVRNQRLEIENRMSEIEKVMAILKTPMIAFDKFELEMCLN